MVHSKCNYSWAVTVSGGGARYPPLPCPLRLHTLSIPSIPPRAPVSPLQHHNWIGQQLTTLQPKQSGTWYFQVVGSNLLLLAALTESKSHRVNNQLSMVSMSSLCVFVCLLMSIKGCLLKKKIQFEELNLIIGHRSLTGRCVLKAVSKGHEWLLLPQKWSTNGLRGWRLVYS